MIIYGTRYSLTFEDRVSFIEFLMFFYYTHRGFLEELKPSLHNLPLNHSLKSFIPQLNLKKEHHNHVPIGIHTKTSTTYHCHTLQINATQIKTENYINNTTHHPKIKKVEQIPLFLY